MGDAYFQGSSVDRTEADNLGSNWTADELIYLRDHWRRMALVDLAEHLGRTEQACQSAYYYQLNRPLEDQWQPANGERAPWQAAEVARDNRPVNTIHDDEDRWWDPQYYRAPFDAT